MIKRNNPDNINKIELLKELIKIRNKQLLKMKSDLKNLTSMKSKLLDLKVNSKDGFFNQFKLRLKIALIIDTLLVGNYELNTKSFAKLSENSSKDLKENTKSSRLAESNDKLIQGLMTEINKMIINTKNKIKDWETKQKSELKSYKQK